MNLNNHPGSITSFLKVVFAFLTPMNSLTSIRALSPSEIQKPNSQYVRLVFTIFFQTFESRSVCNFQTLHWFGVFALDPELWFWSKFHSIQSLRDSQFHTRSVRLEVRPLWSWQSCWVGGLWQELPALYWPTRELWIAVTGGNAPAAVLFLSASTLTTYHRGWRAERNVGTA